MPTPTHRLYVRRLDTIGFVDKGDDPKAEIVFFKRAPDPIDKRIVRRGDKYVVMSEDGSRVLGEHDSLQDAQAQLRTVDSKKRAEDGMLSRVLKALGLKDTEVSKLLADGAGGGSKNDPGTATDPRGGNTMADTFDVTKLDEQAQAEFQKLTARIAELEKAAKPEPEPKDPELPEAVQKAVEAAEKRAQAAEDRVQKLEDQREQEQFIAKAKELSLTADDWATPLRKIRKALSDEEWQRFETHQKAQANQIRESSLYKEIGRGGAGAPTEAEGQVAELVKQYREQHPEWNEERARGEVMKANPQLRNRLEAERLSRTRHVEE